VVGCDHPPSSNLTGKERSFSVMGIAVVEARNQE
jgi:hypothetical protein